MKILDGVVYSTWMVWCTVQHFDGVVYSTAGCFEALNTLASLTMAVWVQQNITSLHNRRFGTASAQDACFNFVASGCLTPQAFHGCSV